MRIKFLTSFVCIALWQKECDHKCKRPNFCKKSKKLRSSTKFTTLCFKNHSTSSRYFSGLKDICLNGLAMWAERFRNGFPNKLYMLKWMGKGWLDDHGQEGLIISRILVGTVWIFVQAKCGLYWWIEKCGCLISSCCTCNPLGKAGEENKSIVYRVQNKKIATTTTL